MSFSSPLKERVKTKSTNGLKSKVQQIEFEVSMCIDSVTTSGQVLYCEKNVCEKSADKKGLNHWCEEENCALYIKLEVLLLER